MKKPSISGFTIVRNAYQLNYPFRESVCSILPLCDEFIINCGDSGDATARLCEELQRQHPRKIKLMFSQWSGKEQQGGFQLKYQTDQALSLCREEWCFYLQADEAIHEGDLPKIAEAIELADARERVDGILFDYLHFYGSFDYVVRGRNWYRREVRVFKNHRGITAYRDAQGFRRQEDKLLVIPSQARIFHYGYVRSPESMRQKSIEMSQWWGTKPEMELEKLQPVRHVGLKRFKGSHPGVMSDRIDRGSDFNPKQCRRKWNRDEIKNALTLAWEWVFPYRIGEFRNYKVV